RAGWRHWHAHARCPRLAGVTAPLRDQVAAAIKDGLARASTDLGWTGVDGVPIEVERPGNPDHGDYASNVALKLAKQVRKPPREIARAIRERVPVAPPIAAVEELSGFVNVRLDEKWLATQVDEIVRAGTDFGRSMALAGKRLQVEFVSANPTGPLTVANARGGPLGDVLSSVLEFAGATVEREYYVEDTGTQFDTFGRVRADPRRATTGRQGLRQGRRRLVRGERSGRRQGGLGARSLERRAGISGQGHRVPRPGAARPAVQQEDRHLGLEHSLPPHPDARRDAGARSAREV